MRKYFSSLIFYLFLAIAFVIVLKTYNTNPQQPKDLIVTQLMIEINQGKVEAIKFQGNNLTGTLKDGKAFKSYVPDPLSRVFGDYVFKASVDEKLKLKVSGVPPANSSGFMDFIFPILIIVALLGFLFVMMMQGGQGGGNKVMSFGKSRAKLQKDEDKKVTFTDVAGLKEEKEEMAEIVDFLKNPKKYRELGARIPKGILLVGPPGTGKTYLTKAVAGEAGVPFFSISGSDFVEMFVGVGASRVRDLFENAKKNAPCIIFIDEIDAVGRKRGAGLGGGHDEREQTLNQLLVEMDGFGDNEGIIIMAATNRPDILDTALLRPGRFDREITVGVPDLREREDILKVHARNKPLDEDVDFANLAKATPGFTPADLENLLNESALLTARKNQKKINMPTIQEATTKVIAGVEKKSRLVSDRERRLTAYHEAGHAVLARLLPDTDPVNQITIIPRGRAGGFTVQLPQEDRRYNTKKRMESELIILLGGRVAEKLMLHDISTGARNDLSRVSEIARAMVTKYAFSENLGSMSYDTEEEVFLGKDMTTRRNYSEQVSADIDMEIRKIVDGSYDMANRLLEQHKDKLQEVAEALLEYETIYADEFEIAFTQGKEALDAFVKKHKKENEGQTESQKHDLFGHIRQTSDAAGTVVSREDTSFETLVGDKSSEKSEDQA